MERILVLAPAEDQARRALGLAAALAERAAAQLTIVRVLEEGLQWSPMDSSELRHQPLRDLLVESERRALEALAEPLRTRGLEVTTEVSWGVAWDVLIEWVERRRIDLLVKPAHGLTHEGRVFFGSTALHLFRKCPCPVWVVGDSGRLPERILAAIDPNTDATRLAAASRILSWARRVEAWTGASLEVASAWHAPGASSLKGRIPQPELDAYVQDAFERARQGLDRILASLAPPIAPDRVHLLEGAARDVLPRFAEEQGFDLTVMGTLGREGLAGELLGETAEMIIREVHSSVLTVSPPRSAASR